MGEIVKNVSRISRCGTTYEKRNIIFNYYVYAITRIKENPIDLRAYIGITRNFLKRKEEHLKRFKNGYKISIVMKQSMTMIEAEKHETKFMSDYIKRNYKLYNRVRCAEHNRCYKIDDYDLNQDHKKEVERNKRIQAKNN